MQLRQFNASDIKCLAEEEGRLGAGGFGIVQCCFHPSLGWIAVKCYPVLGGKVEKDCLVMQ